MPTPNFHDLPDGSSIINHTSSREIASEYICECPPPPPPVNFEITENPFIFTASVPAPPQVNGSRNTAVGASTLAQTPASPPPNPVGYSSEFPPHPSYADGSAPLMPPVRRLRVEELTERRTVDEIILEASELYIDTSPQVCDPSPPRRPRRRREISDPDAAIRKDPNAWSLREAVELCKLLEVVLPEAGFHIALTGDLLYKEGRRKDCDLMFYQIRQVEPNYEVLWKYLTVAGVIRDRGYSENGWLVKATYRGKAIDCLFPNAKKVKKAGAANPDCYKSAPAPAPIVYRPGTLVRHIDGVPEFSAPYTEAELLATPAPAPVPAVEQWEEPF